MLALAIVLIAAGVVVSVYRALDVFAAEGDGTEVRSSAQVVTAVRDLARIESAEYHIERVLDVRDRQSHLFGLLKVEDAVLLVAAADVVAGVDLAEMGDGDIVIDEGARRATIVLPPPRVLMTRLDNEHTFVHTRSTDLLARRDDTLESRARREAEKTLERAAIDAGILDRARRNAAGTVRTLVQALGYGHVEIRWQDRE
ncbi:MAG: DUF4230 domain-containing protein [Myxococcota bacterium]